MLGQHCGFRDLDATDKFYELCAATKNQKPTFMNAVIACGGTGGHLFPGIAVAEVLRDRGHEVMLLISEKDIDALALSGHTNFQVEKLPSIGLPSAFSPAFFGFIRRFYESLSLCRSLYGKFKPQVVLGIHFHCAGPRWTHTRHCHLYSRIKRHSRKGKPTNSAASECGHARLQGMRALFSKNAHGSHRHSSPDRTGALGSESCAPKTWATRRSSDVACYGRQPGRQRN